MEQVFAYIVAYWKAACEILLLAAVIYYFLLLFRGTRAAAILTGLVTVLLVVVGITQIFQLEVINWILSRVLALLAVAVVIIFQPEIRRALAQLGSQQLFGNPRERGELVDVLVEAAGSLAQDRIGALIAVEREVGFRGVAESGVTIDAKATPELLLTIFYPATALHDGGMVIRGDRVVAAGCIFPLTQRDTLGSHIGMRHRAAIGMTEDTDAIIVVVSEETGEISVAQRGHLVQGLDSAGLRAFLATTLMSPARPGNWLVESLRKMIASLMIPRGDEPTATEADGFEPEALVSSRDPAAVESEPASPPMASKPAAREATQ